VVFIINNNEFNSIKSMEGHVMIGRLLMVLVGLVLGMLGIITTVHSDHNVLGVLITFSGVVSMLEGLPNHDV